MKKILSLLISAVICLAFSVTAYATFGGNYVISTTDSVSVSEGMNISNDIQTFEKETGVTPCIVFLDRLTQKNFIKEAEYYSKQHFDYENTFILIHDVNSGKSYVGAFGKYATYVGNKAGLTELGEKITDERIFKDGYYEGALKYLDYVRMMIDAYEKDDFAWGVNDTINVIGAIINVGKWLIGPILGALAVMSIYKSVVRRQYRNLEKTSMSKFESKSESIFYYTNDVFVREYIHTDD